MSIDDENTAPSTPLDRARSLRRNSTGPERALWRELRQLRRLGLKFRRQAPIGAFVVDFFELARRLVIELDGESHVGRGEYDVERQAWLEERQYQVFRVSNDDVIRDLDTVVEAVVEFGRRRAAEPG